jgi:hypothetical protein
MAPSGKWPVPSAEGPSTPPSQRHVDERGACRGGERERAASPSTTAEATSPAVTGRSHPGSNVAPLKLGMLNRRQERLREKGLAKTLVRHTAE